MTESSAPYADWEETLDAITAAPGTTLLLGDTDVGKTTFARLLVNRLVKAGQRAAFLDADVGQSEVGPPACMGLAFIESPTLALSDLSPHALAFVGSNTPHGHALEYIGAVHHLATLAGASAGPLIVDTPGYLHGAGARRLHQTTFELLSPKYVVALQQGEGLNPIILPFLRHANCQVLTPPVPAVIGKKPPAYRTQRRAMRFASYFQNAELHTYAFDDMAFMGTWMGSGTPLAAHLLAFVRQTLAAHTKVYYGELCNRHLGLMVSDPLPPQFSALGVVQRELAVRALTVTSAPRLKHLLVGLESGQGKLLGLGVLQALDFRRRTLGVVTPVRAPAAACILRFGSLRVQPDGKEVGSLKPGEI